MALTENRMYRIVNLGPDLISLIVLPAASTKSVAVTDRGLKPNDFEDVWVGILNNPAIEQDGPSVIHACCFDLWGKSHGTLRVTEISRF